MAILNCVFKYKKSVGVSRGDEFWSRKTEVHWDDGSCYQDFLVGKESVSNTGQDQKESVKMFLKFQSRSVCLQAPLLKYSPYYLCESIPFSLTFRYVSSTSNVSSMSRTAITALLLAESPVPKNCVWYIVGMQIGICCINAQIGVWSGKGNKKFTEWVWGSRSLRGDVKVIYFSSKG